MSERATEPKRERIVTKEQRDDFVRDLDDKQVAIVDQVIAGIDGKELPEGKWIDLQKELDSQLKNLTALGSDDKNQIVSELRRSADAFINHENADRDWNKEVMDNYHEAMRTGVQQALDQHPEVLDTFSVSGDGTRFVSKEIVEGGINEDTSDLPDSVVPPDPANGPTRQEQYYQIPEFDKKSNTEKKLDLDIATAADVAVRAATQEIERKYAKVESTENVPDAAEAKNVQEELVTSNSNNEEANELSIENFPQQGRQFIDILSGIQARPFDKMKGDIKKAKDKEISLETRIVQNDEVIKYYDGLDDEQKDAIREQIKHLAENDDDPRYFSLNVDQLIARERLDHNEWMLVAEKNAGLNQPFSKQGTSLGDLYKSFRQNSGLSEEQLAAAKEALAQEEREHVDEVDAIEVIRSRVEALKSHKDPEMRKKHPSAQQYLEQLENNFQYTSERNEALRSYKKGIEANEEIERGWDNMTKLEKTGAEFRYVKNRIKNGYHRYVARENDLALKIDSSDYSKTGKGLAKFVLRSPRGVAKIIGGAAIIGMSLVAYGYARLFTFTKQLTKGFINLTQPEKQFEDTNPFGWIKKDTEAAVGASSSTASNKKNDKKQTKKDTA